MNKYKVSGSTIKEKVKWWCKELGESGGKMSTKWPTSESVERIMESRKVEVFDYSRIKPEVLRKEKIKLNEDPLEVSQRYRNL